MHEFITSLICHWHIDFLKEDILLHNAKIIHVIINLTRKVSTCWEIVKFTQLNTTFKITILDSNFEFLSMAIVRLYECIIYIYIYESLLLIPDTVFLKS